MKQGCKNISKAMMLLLFAITAAHVAAQPTWNQSFNPSTISPGGVSTLRFTITNNTGSPIPDLAFTNVLPAGVTIATPANVNIECDASWSAPAGGDTITMSNGRLGTGSSCSFSLDVTSTVIGTHANISGDLTSNQGNSGNSSANLTVSADRPSFSKSFSPSSVQFGDRSTLTFTIDNTANPNNVGFMRFEDTFPSGMIIADPVNFLSDCIGIAYVAAPGSDTFSLTNGNIFTGDTCTISIDIVAGGVGELENITGEFTSNSGVNFGASSGSASATLNVVNSQISLIKEFVDDPTVAGDNVTLRYTVQNFSREFSATNISFTDDLDLALSGLTSISGTLTDPVGAGSSFSGTDFVTLTNGSLAPEEQIVFEITLAVPGGTLTGSYPSTTGNISADVDGAMVVGGTATDTLFVQPVPTLDLVYKHPTTLVSDPAVANGGSILMEYTITNTSTIDTLTNISMQNDIDDLFGTNINIISLPAPGFCNGTGFINIIASNDDRAFQVTGASLAAGASCSFEIEIGIGNDMNAGPYTDEVESLTGTIAGIPVEGNTTPGTFTIVSVPRLSKSFDPTNVLAGDTMDLDFSLTHDADNSGDAVNVTFTDDLGAVLAGLVATGLPLNDVCGPGNGTLTGSAGDTFLTFTGATFSPGDTCDFTVTLQVPGSASPNSYSNTTSQPTATILGESGTGNAANASFAVIGLQETGVFTPSSVLPGATTDLEITIENLSTTDTATSITLRNELSTVLTGATFVNAPQANVCGAGSSVSFFSGNRRVDLISGSLAPGASCSFTVTVNVPVVAADSDYNLTPTLFSADFGSGPVSLPTTGATFTVDSNLLSLQKSFTDDPVTPGDTVTLEFTLTNLDPTNTASAVTFTDNLDAALSGLVATGLPANDVCGAGSQISGTSTLTLTGGNLAGGASCTFSVTLQVPAGVPLGTNAVNTTSTVSGLISGLAVTGPAASDTLRIQSMSLSKSFDGPSTATGTPVLTFTLQNLSGSQTFTSLAFSDDLDAVVSGLVATGLPVNDVCGVGSQISGTSFLTLTGASLGPGEICTINVDLLVPVTASPGTYANTSSILTSSGLQVAEAATADLVIEPAPLFSKQFAPTAIGEGFTSTLTLSIDNSASALAADNLAFTDNFPAGLIVATPVLNSNTCGGTLSAIAGSGSISLGNGSVAAGGTCTIQVLVEGSAAGTMNNTSGDLTSSSGNSGTASATLVVDPQPGFSKNFAPDPILLGGTTTLTFTIDNSSSLNTASSLAFTDNLPAGLAVASPNNLSTTCTGGTLTGVAGTTTISYSGGSIAASGTCTVQVDVVGNTAGNYSYASGNLTSSLGNSGSASDSLVVDPPPSFSKTFAADPIFLGEDVSLTFTIDNSLSSVAATNLSFSDTYPAGLVNAAVPGVVDGCSGIFTANAAANSITYSGGSVPAFSSCTVSVQLNAIATGPYTNTSGSLTSSSGNSGTASDTIRINPQPGFSKLFNPDSLGPDQISTLIFTVDNSGSSVAATNLDFTDNFPAGLVIAAVPNTSTTCTGGSITAVAGNGVFSYSGGSAPAFGTCTLRVDVTSSTPDTYNNTTGDLTSDSGNSGTASDTLIVNPLPGFSKTFLPDPILLNETSTLTFTIDNSGAAATASNLSFIDTLPAGLSIASPANASTTCTGGTLTATTGTTSISYSGGSLLGGSTCTVTVDISGDSAGSYNYSSGDLTSSLGNSGTATASLVVNPPPVFAKAFAADPILLGQTTTLTFTIDNQASTIAATSLDFTDNLPAGLIVATPGNAATTCTGGTLTAVDGGGTITYSGGTIAAGGTCTVTVDILGNTAGTFLNTSGDLTSSLGNSGPSSDSLTVNPPPAFSKLFSPDALGPNQISTLTFTIDNSGATVDALNLDFTDNFPAGLVIATTPNAVTTCTGGTISAVAGTGTFAYTGGTLLAGQTCTLSVDTNSASDGIYNNTSGNLTSSLGNSGTAADTLTVNPLPGFSKAFADGTILVGQTTTLTFTIDNSSSSQAAGNLSFTDNFPAGITIAATPNAATTCTGGTLTAPAEGSTLTYSGGTLAGGADCTVTVDIVGVTGGSQVNTSSDLTSSLGNSGSATDTIHVNPPPTFTKAFSPNMIDPNQATVLTFTIDNSVANAAAGNLSFTDNFPTGLIVFDPADASTTCTGGTITAVTGSGTFSYSGGSVDAGATCTLQVSVTSADPGKLTNISEELTSSLGNSGTAEAGLAVGQAADLVLTMSGSPDPVIAGETLTYTLNLTNNGPSDAFDVEIQDTLPAGLTLVSTSGCDEDPTALPTCTIGTLTTGANRTITIVAELDSDYTGSLENTATASSSTLEFEPGDETATETTTVEAQSDLTVVFQPGDDTTPGGTYTCTFTVTNNGPSDAPGTTVEALFPAELTNTAWTCSAVGGTCPGGGSGDINTTVDLPAAAVVTFTLTADVPDDVWGELTTTAEATTAVDVTDPNPADNSAEKIVLSRSPADVSGTLALLGVAGKDFQELTVSEGDILQFEVVMTNTGAFAQVDDPLSDEFFLSLPDGLDLTGAQIISGGGLITQDGNTDTLTWNGEIPAGGGIILQFQAQIEPNTTGQLLSVQGTINYDSDGDGTNDSSVGTDNPNAPGGTGPTLIFIAPPIPTMGTWTLFLFIAALAGFAVKASRGKTRPQS